MQEGLIGQLINALRCLPSVGPKSAQRMAMHLLQRDKSGALRLAQVIQEALDKVGLCQHCRTLTEKKVCHVCSDNKRDRSIICVVESPADVYAVNQVTIFNGLFFVLHGRLSPLDGIGPEELGLNALEERLKNEAIQELILATNSTVEGEATAHYLGEMARRYGVKSSRIAYGMPLGGELEYIDSGTLSHAFSGRKEIS